MSYSAWLNTLRNDLEWYIFTNEFTRLLKEQHRLVNKNASLGMGQDGFFYEGKLYSRLQINQYKGHNTSVSLFLVDEVESFVRDKKQVDFDRDRVKQILTVILADCKTNQDIRDALPNSLSNALIGTKDLERTRPETWTIINNNRAYKQYLEIRDKIDYYIALKLMY